MARGRSKNSAPRIKSRTSTRRRAPAEDALPDVYQNMLAVATPSSPTRASEEGRVIKKRRVGGRMITQGQKKETVSRDTTPDNSENTKPDSKQILVSESTQQTAYDSSESSEDSDMAWEEVDLDNTKKVEENDNDDSEDLNLILDNGPSKSTRSFAKKKPASAAERNLRLEIHKMHVLSLLIHIHLRNHWCNDEQVQSSLEKILSQRIISYLNPNKDLSQFQRSRSFMDGLEQVRDLFKKEFKITARGTNRSYWAESSKDLANFNLPTDIDLPIGKSDFQDAATKLKGSRDIGAQMFCALLRTAGVEARLVCSLQPLPFTMAMKGTTSQKSASKSLIIVVNPESLTATTDDESNLDIGSDTSMKNPSSLSVNGMPSQIKSKLTARLGRAPPVNAGDVTTSTSMLPKKPKNKKIHESPYPVYWVEAFNTAVQKWIPVDALVTNVIAKSSKFEPPASDQENNLTYVVAFEENGSARDVTKRYAKAYNAKTRRNRVEITKGGDRWWRRVMRMYKRTYDLDRDQVEDAELAAKEAAEEMPKNIQDFKDHPYYALERHLRRNEVIHPKRQAGSVSSGKIDKKNNLEPIYRRQDVHMVKSADSWYRLGREIKAGEQPLKRVQSRRKREMISEEGSEDEENAGTGMYAPFQTIIYQAPPVVNGRIPKNAYGNLDIYVPSMVPEGGIHISNSETAKAAKILGIDYSDAVTGFEFKGRHGTAIVKGAVIAVQYQEAVEQVLQCFDDERVEAEETRRSLEALRLWKRFLTGLRINERVQGYKMEGERDDFKGEPDQVDEAMSDEAIGGGFMLSVDEPVAEPTVRQFVRRPSEESYGDLSRGFLPDDNEKTNVGFNSDGQVQASLGEEVVDGGGFDVKVDEKTPTSDQVLDANICKRKTEHVDLERNRFTRDIDNEIGHLEIKDHLQPQAPKEIPSSLTDPPPSKLRTPGRTVQSADTNEDFMLGSSENSDKKESLNIPPHAILPSEDIEEAMMLQQIYQTEGLTQNNHETHSEVVDPAQGIPEPEDDKSSEVPVPATMVQETQDDDDDDDDDKGSLLSHDPSDEDADPDWLA